MLKSPVSRKKSRGHFLLFSEVLFINKMLPLVFHWWDKQNLTCQTTQTNKAMFCHHVYTFQGSQPENVSCSRLCTLGCDGRELLNIRSIAHSRFMSLEGRAEFQIFHFALNTKKNLTEVLSLVVYLRTSREAL